MGRPIVMPNKKAEEPKSFIGMVGAGAAGVGDALKGVGDATVATVTDPGAAAKGLVDGASDMGKGLVDGTVKAVTDPVAAGKGFAEGTMAVGNAIGEGTMAVAGTAVDATVGLANDTIDAGSAVVDISAGAIEKSFELLGVTGAFQSVFGGDVDKSDEGLEKAFKKVDADGSGKMSATEMKEYIVSVYGKGLDEKIVTDMMKAADTDGDGEVDLKEFKAIMRAGPEKQESKSEIVKMASSGVGAVLGGTVGAAKAVGDATVKTVTNPVGAMGDATTAVVDTTTSVAKGTVDVVTDPVKAVDNVAKGTVDVVGGAVSATTDVVKAAAADTVSAGTAAVETTASAGKLVVDISAGAIEKSFELLGVTGAFQSVFGGANIDKSDEGLEKAFKKVDADGSGKMSATEMKEYIVSVYGKGLDEKIVTDMMKAADTDGDGEVDLKEFKAIMRAGPESK